jgi:hypothetical protein
MRWISEPDKGAYDAMNKGIKFAKGALVSFLNSSDWYKNNTLESVLKFYSDKKPFSVIYGVVNYYNTAGDILYAHGVHHNMLNSYMIAHPATFMSRELLLELNGFNQKYKIAADYDLMLKASKNANTSFVYADEILANFVEGGLSSDILKTTLETLEIKKNHGIITGRMYYYKMIKTVISVLLKKIIK